MKSYKEYMEIIKEKEAKEATAKYGGDLAVNWVDLESKFTFDYSVEIMGMMMQDFLDELRTLKEANK